MSLKTIVSTILLAMMAVACSSGSDRNSSRPLTLESIGIQPEYNNGERGLWVRTEDGRTIWAAESKLCLQTWRPMSKTKIKLPNGNGATFYDKKCTVTCTCTSGDSGCNKVYGHDSCGCFTDGCSNCTEGA